MPAVMSGPHGCFTHAHATGHQLWIAGGRRHHAVPGWLRSLDTHPPAGRVDVFHAVRDDAIRPPRRSATWSPTADVGFDLVPSNAGRRLSADYVLESSGADPGDATVFVLRTGAAAAPPSTPGSGPRASPVASTAVLRLALRAGTDEVRGGTTKLRRPGSESVGQPAKLGAQLPSCWCRAPRRRRPPAADHDQGGDASHRGNHSTTARGRLFSRARTPPGATGSVPQDPGPAAPPRWPTPTRMPLCSGVVIAPNTAATRTKACGQGARRPVHATAVHATATSPPSDLVQRRRR